MVTLPGTDGIPTDPAVQRFQYVTPSPTAASLDGSGMRHEIYAEPTLVTPQSESKPVKQEKEEFKTTFQFVVNEDAKEARNTVRKHVMREYRRRERWEQGQRGPPEKKPAVPAPKKRRRKQVRSPEEEGQSAIQEMPPEILPDAPPVEQRNDPGAQKDEEGKSQGSSGGGAKSPGSSGSENQPAPTKKKLRVVSPIFPESKQHQLWGAVATDYDDAIAELEGNKITPYTADPWAGVAVNEIDPFSKLKLELGPATSSLLHHCMFNRLSFRARGYADWSSCLGHAKSNGRDRNRQSISPPRMAILGGRNTRSNAGARHSRLHAGSYCQPARH